MHEKNDLCFRAQLFLIAAPEELLVVGCNE